MRKQASLMILSKEATMLFQWPIFNNVKKEPNETTSPQAYSNFDNPQRATIPMSRPPKPFDFIPNINIDHCYK
jgi:hypothetical protein